MAKTPPDPNSNTSRAKRKRRKTARWKGVQRVIREQADAAALRPESQSLERDLSAAGAKAQTKIKRHNTLRSIVELDRRLKLMRSSNVVIRRRAGAEVRLPKETQ